MHSPQDPFNITAQHANMISDNGAAFIGQILTVIAAMHGMFSRKPKQTYQTCENRLLCALGASNIRHQRSTEEFYTN